MEKYKTKSNGWVSCSHENSFDSTSKKLNEGRMAVMALFYSSFDAK